MQRVRIGLTGLAFVFLVVMMAMVFTREAAHEEPITANLLERQRAGEIEPPPKAAPPAAPAEPLAELGVAPGKEKGNSTAPAPAPPNEPARR